MGQNDFLGEIHIPLSNCTFDVMKEYKLLAQQKKSDVSLFRIPTTDDNKRFPSLVITDKRINIGTRRNSISTHFYSRSEK